MAPTNGENSVRIDHLEQRIDRHSQEWDDRFQNFGIKVDLAMEKITDKIGEAVEKFMERVHLIEITAEKYDKENNVKIAKVATKVSILVSVVMTTFGLVLAAIIKKL